MSVLRRAKPETAFQEPAMGNVSAVYDFFVRELLPENARLASVFTDAVRQAVERYNRYVWRRDEWFDYTARRDKLESIVKLIEGLASDLGQIDVLSRDDLDSRLGSKEIDRLIGSLRRIGKETTILVKEAQTDGRRRDLAEERWILECADIYENAFHQPASVWGTEGGPVKGRRSFYRLLELSRSPSRKWHGKLHPRQVDRVLKRRCPK